MPVWVPLTFAVIGLFAAALLASFAFYSLGASLDDASTFVNLEDD